MLFKIVHFSCSAAASSRFEASGNFSIGESRTRSPVVEEGGGGGQRMFVTSNLTLRCSIVSGGDAGVVQRVLK